jgi:hypothetical protein
MDDNERIAWWNIVKKCWMQDPNQRPTMDEVETMISNLRKVIFDRLNGTQYSLVFI